jgi:small subunit ribosomal protein S3
MGHKVNPISFRIGIVENWRSRWSASKKDFGKYLVQDAKIREMIRKKYRSAAIAMVEIERKSGEEIIITLHTARPGIVIGRRGAEVEKLRDEIEAITGPRVTVNIKEVQRPELNAQLVAEGLAEQIEKRASYKRAMKTLAETAMNSGAEGIKIRCAGRLGGAEIARSEDIRLGKVPLHTLKVKIDYGTTEATTQYGNIGIKVWTYCGDQEEAT